MTKVNTLTQTTKFKGIGADIYRMLDIEEMTLNNGILTVEWGFEDDDNNCSTNIPEAAYESWLIKEGYLSDDSKLIMYWEEYTLPVRKVHMKEFLITDHSPNYLQSKRA